VVDCLAIRRGHSLVSLPLWKELDMDLDATYEARVLRSCREKVEVIYLQQLQAGTVDFVIVVDAQNQEERDNEQRAKRDLPESLPIVHTKISVHSWESLLQNM
jgi:hypothetical protein